MVDLWMWSVPLCLLSPLCNSQATAKLTYSPSPTSTDTFCPSCEVTATTSASTSTSQADISFMLSSWTKLFLLVYISSLGALALGSVPFDSNYFQVPVLSYFGRTLELGASNVEPQQDLLSAFHVHYHRFEHAIQEALVNTTDSTVLARLGDDLDEFSHLVTTV